MLLPAVVVWPQAPLSVGELDAVVGVLESLVPVEALQTIVEASLVLLAPVVLTVGRVAFWNTRESLFSTISKQSLWPGQGGRPFVACH